MTSDHIIFKGKLLHVVKRVWRELYDKYRDFVVVYNSEVKQNESTDEIDVAANFQALFKDKYSTPRSSTPIENHFRPRQKNIFSLQQYNKEK